MKVSVSELIEAIEKLPPPKEYSFPQISIEVPERVMLNLKNGHGNLIPEKKIFFDKSEDGCEWEINLD